jgi:hypothetical protein
VRYVAALGLAEHRARCLSELALSPDRAAPRACWAPLALALRLAAARRRRSVIEARVVARARVRDDLGREGVRGSACEKEAETGRVRVQTSGGSERLASRSRRVGDSACALV